MARAIDEEDAEYAGWAPLHSGCTQYELDVSTTSAAITIANNSWYEVCLVADAGYAVCKFGASAVLATTGNSAAATFALFPGVPRVVFASQGETSLNCKLSTGTGSLVLTKLERRAAL